MIQTRRKFSKEFKAQAVELAQAGRPVPELAAELEVGTNLLYRWMRGSQGAQLKLENDILRKAAEIIGTNPQPKGVK